ncbi:MAG: NAD(P)/FAD-dependent oxidoreductase [Chloroflexi bacterium]|nr:NAD(P)/FAD-dependent oxidoreductase [Chloroflexota bacterium]
MHDVLVIGAGPAGSHTAARLAAYGHSVLVIEKKPGVTGKPSCAGIIGRECAGLLDLDAGGVLRAARSARFFSPSGLEIAVARPETQYYTVDRRAFDGLLADRARRLGVEYRFDTAAAGIFPGPGGVTVETAAGGKTQRLQARAAVFAGGFSPSFGRRLGLGRIRDFVAGAQAEVEAAVDEVEVYFDQALTSGFFGWLAPSAPGRARVGLLARRSPAASISRLMAALIARGKIFPGVGPVRYGAIPLGALPRTSAERLLVVGDAAGQVKPTTCGGIYYGLLAAGIAARTLHDALAAGDLSATRLAGYDRAWRKKLGRELRTGYWARRLFESLSNERIDRIFTVMKSRRIDRKLVEDRDVSFDWHGKFALSLAGQLALAGVIDSVRAPFRAKIDPKLTND